ncbi:MAG: PmoA family protein [Humibacter sp.]
MNPHAQRKLSLLHEVDRGLTVTAAADGEPGVQLMRYVYRPDEVQYESPRPYVHPIRTPGGRLVTVFRPWDHVWHKGVTLALPVVGGDNFWGGPTYTRAAAGYVKLPNNGSQDHERVTALTQRDGTAVFAHELTWHRQPAEGEQIGVAVFTERRSITATLLPEHEAWVLGWRTVLTNVSGASIEMGSPTTEGRENAGYGGLFWRGPRAFTGGEIVGSDGTTGEDVRGTRGEWAGFNGRHDGEDGASTVVFVDRSPSQGFDTKWFARSEPFACINPAPFFDRVRVIEAGETIELRHAVTFADGASDADRMSVLARTARGVTESADDVVAGIHSETKTETGIHTDAEGAR